MGPAHGHKAHMTHHMDGETVAAWGQHWSGIHHTTILYRSNHEHDLHVVPVSSDYTCTILSILYSYYIVQ